MGVGKRNIWKQSSNPFTATGMGVDGYEALAEELDYTGAYWQGLEYNIGGESWLDGSVNVFAWNYAIG